MEYVLLTFLLEADMVVNEIAKDDELTPPPGLLFVAPCFAGGGYKWRVQW